jgi:hypothetical protein
MEKYCQNPLCENEAVKEVPVSIRKPSDQKRSLCAACEEVFTWGLQQGSMMSRRRRVWVLAIADRGMVVFGKGYPGKAKAVQGLAEYLKTNEDYTGPAAMPSISDWLAEHDERLSIELFAASLDASGDDQASEGLMIDSPPREEGAEGLYRVIYTIDVNARDARQAAERAYEIMTDRQSLRPVLHILDGRGPETTVDLAEEPAPPRGSAEPSASREKALRFVQASGTRCPQCGSRDIDFGTVQVEAQSAFQDAGCQDCEARFYGVYRLVGYGLHHDGSCEVHTIDEDSGKIAGQSG